MPLSAFAFNFLVNGALAFGAACLLVAAVLRTFRVGPGRAQLALLAMPWLKLTWDAGRGIPESSFFWQRLLGVRQELGAFQLGLGANHWGPLLQLRLGALHAGRHYPQSAAEVLDSALTRLAPRLPLYLTAGVLLISGLLTTRRLAAWWVHGAARRRGGALPLFVRRTGRRQVRVYVEADHTGAPYAAGVFAPYVVFSAAHYARLSPVQREACLLHELSHVAHGDTWLSPLLALLGDLFWFLPGARWLSRRAAAVMELRADAAAVEAGAGAEVLASVLVQSGEQLHATGPGVGLLRDSLLVRRVRRLLVAPEPPPRLGFQRRWFCVVLLCLLLCCLLQSVFFGNYASS
jgi:Zn-dependent protease with chaperone function